MGMRQARYSSFTRARTTWPGISPAPPSPTRHPTSLRAETCSGPFEAARIQRFMQMVTIRHQTVLHLPRLRPSSPLPRALRACCETSCQHANIRLNLLGVSQNPRCSVPDRGVYAASILAFPHALENSHVAAWAGVGAV